MQTESGSEPSLPPGLPEPTRARRSGGPRRLLLIAPLVLVVLAALAVWLIRPYEYRGQLLDPPETAGGFALTDQFGRPFRLADQRGKVVLLFFGYTMCPDVCPATLGKWAKTRRELGGDAERVLFIYITVDPERDTVGQLREHLDRIDPSFIGLTGSREALEVVWKNYGAFAEKQPSSSELGYLVAHSAYTYLLDESGNVKVLYSFDVTADDMTADLRHLLR